MSEFSNSTFALPDPEFLSPHALLAAIVDSSDDAIVSKNLQGIITSWNKGAERIFGYDAAEIVGDTILRLLPPERKDEEGAILERLQRGERLEHYETIRVRKDGTRIDVSLTISPIKNAAGVIVGASKIARDITEQKNAQVRLAQAHEQLKRADRMKVEFISTLSHELRTPLTAISGWIQLLKGGASQAELAEGLETIERNVRVQSQLIEDLLDISRIESGKMSLDLQRIDVSTIVEAALESVRPTAEARSIRLTCAFANVSGVVMGDKNRLQQIVWNLLTNAIKFTPKHGRVHTTIGRVNSHLEIAVSDSGLGISPEFVHRIFERFSQADASTTRRHGGLGLGLSIAKHLVELHGGSICASSPGENQGSTFTVTPPLLAVDHTQRSGSSDGSNLQWTEPHEDKELAGVKLLVVDDDRDSAGVLARILTRSGAEVHTASSMNEALRAFDQFTADVVLSDIGMPEHDGYEFITRLRATEGGRKVPAVALTALARSEDRTRALRAGFQMHMAKPVDGAELIAVVRNLASLHSMGRRQS